MVTVDRKEKEKFETIDSDWWNQKGPVGALHAFAPVRIDYILRTIERFSNQLNYKKRDGAYNLGPLEGLKILDIGCGGGILAEPITRLGASVTESIFALPKNSNFSRGEDD